MLRPACWRVLQLLLLASTASGCALVTPRGVTLQAAFSDFRLNSISHAHDLDRSSALGYECIRALPDMEAAPGVRAYEVPTSATAMGPACPFAFASPDQPTLPLVFETCTPLFSDAECEVFVDEARAHIAAGTPARARQRRSSRPLTFSSPALLAQAVRPAPASPSSTRASLSQ
jgi:hypothetical protein